MKTQKSLIFSRIVLRTFQSRMWLATSDLLWHASHGSVRGRETSVQPTVDMLHRLQKRWFAKCPRIAEWICGLEKDLHAKCQLCVNFRGKKRLVFQGFCESRFTFVTSLFLQKKYCRLESSRRGQPVEGWFAGQRSAGASRLNVETSAVHSPRITHASRLTL